MTRTDNPPASDERSHLVTFLSYVRATAVAKCEGVSEGDARRAPLPGSPLMTMSGLISHLRWVEYFWIQVMFLGEADEGPWTEEDPDREMRIATEIPLAELIASYEQQSARYETLLNTLDLDSTAKQPNGSGTHVTLRWVILHLIEETARHNGHLDVLRELADGTTGV
ncbi:DinB family protein [Streptomyces canus]|uniref:DinB family protein n=1 Tax=Streptomyces canus TaxID=58343 RepID=UPI002E2CE880|nr:DinB family protein [Streptomyces canus]